MNVKGIFITLITIVACVIIGAFFLNILVPNVTTTLVNSAEAMINQAAGLSFDFNGDGASTGNAQEGEREDVTGTISGEDGSTVEGFTGGTVGGGS